MTARKKLQRANRASDKSDARQFLEDITGGALTFGGALHAVRTAAEISQAEFGRRVGATRAHICDLEKGRRGISPGRAAEFARALEHSEVLFVQLAVQDLFSHDGLDMHVVVKSKGAA